MKTVWMARWIALGVCGLTLVACGGGGSDSPPEAVAAAPRVERVNASVPGLLSYLGRWESDCGIALLGGSVRSVRNVYEWRQGTAGTLDGTLEQYQYTDSTCSTPFGIAAAGFPNVRQFLRMRALGVQDAAQRNGSIPGSGSTQFEGTTDWVEISTSSTLGGSVTGTQQQYIAFRADGRWFLANSLPFSALSLSYARR